MFERFSLVVPTHNRPTMLGQLTGFLHRQGFTSPIIVCDSSSPENREKNKQLLVNVTNAQHLVFASDVHPREKWLAGLKKVTTPYCAFCADDDFIIPDGVIPQIEFLDRSHDYVAAEGFCLLFNAQNQGVDFYIEYDAPSIDDENLVERAITFLRKYQAIYYGVFRTPVLIHAFEYSGKAKGTMFSEITMGLATLAQGKFKRLPVVSGLRRAAHEAPHHDRWHPGLWAGDDSEDLLAYFSEYKDFMIGLLGAAQPHLSMAQLRHYTNRLLWLYFLSHTDPNMIAEKIAGHSFPPRESLVLPETLPLFHSKTRLKGFLIQKWTGFCRRVYLNKEKQFVWPLKGGEIRMHGRLGMYDWATTHKRVLDHLAAEGVWTWR